MWTDWFENEHVDALLQSAASNFHLVQVEMVDGTIHEGEVSLNGGIEIVREGEGTTELDSEQIARMRLTTWREVPPEDPFKVDWD